MTDFYALIDAAPVKETEHFFGDIPVNEYWNVTHL